MMVFGRPEPTTLQFNDSKYRYRKSHLVSKQQGRRDLKKLSLFVLIICNWLELLQVVESSWSVEQKQLHDLSSMYRRTCSVLPHWSVAFISSNGSSLCKSRCVGSMARRFVPPGARKRPLEIHSVVETYRFLTTNSDDIASDDFQLQQQEKQKESFLVRISDSLSGDILPQVLNDAEGPRYVEKTPVIVFLLAVSGGCDSVALFHSLLDILSNNQSSDGKMNFIVDSCPFPCEMHVAHFDHQQRGPESDGDRLFVKNLCDKAGVPFHCFFWEGNEKIDDHKPFSQEIARDWRRSNLQDLLTTLTSSSPYGLHTNERLGLVLTAHHRDDAEETILLKILRGAHITNISGMNKVAYMEQEKSQTKTTFAKPMLSVRKMDIVNYLKSKGFIWREDASNSSNKYLRNRVRNELMPLLRDIVGGDIILQVCDLPLRCHCVYS